MNIVKDEQPSELGTKSEGSEKTLTRAQRRIIERIETEAQAMHAKLANKFIDHLINSENPTPQELKAKADNLSAQWKMYVKRAGLKDTVLNLIEDYCTTAIAEFNALKEGKPEVAKPNPETVLEAAEQDKLT